MKIMIKDLTYSQKETICNKYMKRDINGKVHCYECPLAIQNLKICIYTDRKYVMKELGDKYVDID